MSVGTVYPDSLRVSSLCLDTVLIAQKFFGGIAGAFNLPSQIPCSILDCFIGLSFGAVGPRASASFPPGRRIFS
jgi:hypothetical protein